MTYATYSANTHFSVSLSTPASPNASALFGHAQSPRGNHVMYDDLHQAFGSNNGRTRTINQKKQSSSSIKGLKKILRAM
jgi:hypothetical protein